MVGIVNYGMGNLKSVYNAIQYLGGDVMICESPSDLSKATKIIIPGVGAFEKCITNLYKAKFAEELHDYIFNKAVPTLGICVGMQIMAAKGFENGDWDGLNWFDSEVVRINNTDNNLKVPNIGWTETNVVAGNPLFKNTPEKPVYYFVHSYHMKCKNQADVIATYEYGETITAAVMKNNVVATQFHPEKSQDVGLQFLENFLSWKP